VNAAGQTTSASNADLEQFKDLSGITIKRLKFGLWWIEHQKFFKQGIFGLLMIVGGISWLYTIFSFGYYIAVGMRKDDLLLRQLTANQTATHQMVLANAPVPLHFEDVQVINSVDGSYDYILKASNPNLSHYVRFQYQFSVDGQPTEVRSDFILPGDTKYISLLGQRPASTPGNVEFKTTGLIWQRINRHQIPDWNAFRNARLDFNITEPKFNSGKTSGLSEKLAVSQVEFTITNNSAFNYFELPLYIYLYNFDRVIGVTKTSVSQFQSAETKSMQVNVPGQLDQVDRVQIVPDVDIMRQDVYQKFKGVENQ
jgi:hypothetical protein